MTREEHLAWAKERALEYVDAGDLSQAFASLTSDLGKHDELAGALKIQHDLGWPQYFAGHFNTAARMRAWIEGFN